MHSNWRYALLAIVLAFISWYYVSGREQVETWVDIPVEFTSMPENLVVLDGLKSRISVRLRGSKGMIRNLDPRGMIYSLSLKGLQPGVNVIPFKTDSLPVTKAFEVMEISPSRLTLEADQLVVKTVPVKPGWAGNLSDDVKFVGIRAAPSDVAIKGPAGVLDAIDAVGTQPLTVPRPVHLLVEGDVPVILPENVHSQPERVHVTLEFVYKTTEEVLEVPLEVEAPLNVMVDLQDKTVLLTLAVPLPLKRQEDWGGRIVALVSVPESALGKQELEYEVQAPEGVTILNREPEKVRVSVAPAIPMPRDGLGNGVGDGSGLH